MITLKTNLLWVLLSAAGVSTLSWARNDGFSRDSGSSRSEGWGANSRGGTAPADSSRASAAPAVSRSFSRPEVSERSAPVTTYNSSRSAQAPAVYSAPAARSAGPDYSGRAQTVSPQQAPVYSAPRVMTDSSPRFQADASPRSQTVAPARESAAAPFQPTRSVSEPRVQAAERVQEQSVQRTRQDVQTVTPRYTPQTENARSFGTARSPAPAVETPIITTTPNPARSQQDRSWQSTPRTESRIPSEAASRTDAGRTAARERDYRADQQAPQRQTSRGETAFHDAAASRTTSPRVNGNDFRLDSSRGSGSSTVSPMRFGTTGTRGTHASRDDASTLPSALSLRSRGDADTDRFGRAAIPRTAASTPAPRSGLPRASDPTRIGASRHGDNNSLYRPPFGSTGDSHQPFHAQHPPFSGSHPPQYYLHHDNDHHGYDHHDGHYHHHPGYYGWYSPYAFCPTWWGPVVYPAGFGLTWHSGSFALSIATYAPAYYYPRYYDSWYCGGWGYTSVYYGGWRHGWYGGFSYVYNPWPAYRTYYFYDPYPVTETVYVTQPASTTVYVTQPATTTVVTEQAPAATAYAAAPAAYASAPAASASAGYSSSWDSAPAVKQSETAATTCFCPCRCNGMRPCTCAYPCGSEYALRDEDLDLSAAFTSYADSLNAESIWSSYGGLDRWDNNADAYDKSALATASDSTY